MNKEKKIVIYDYDLDVEVYWLEEITRPFPTHFHEYYVIGYMEAGERTMLRQEVHKDVQRNDIILFNPQETHGCMQKGDTAMNYRSLNISKKRMLELTKEITGSSELPGFTQTIVQADEIVEDLRALHEMIMNKCDKFEKEEALYLVMAAILQSYTQPFDECIPECRKEIEEACAFMDTYFTESISLDQIANVAGLSKSTLLRAFTKSKGLTPYRYLETIRIEEAKKLLEQGSPPIEVAMRTGFSDQSHFSHYFNQFIGVSPGVYRTMFLDKAKVNQKDEE